MRLLNLIQGSPEWRAHRQQHFNASEAAAMLGVCPYKTREQLLREKATGEIPLIDSFTQRRFDQGHQFENLARNWLENRLKEEIKPGVGIVENRKISASFDGINSAQSLVFEHKTINAALRQLKRNGQSAADLPLHYRVQMEQQLWVSGAEKALFMASRWDIESERLIEYLLLEYAPDSALRQRIKDGWQQFETDLQDYIPVSTSPVIIDPPALESLPDLRVTASGRITAGNMQHITNAVQHALRDINRDLKDDADFIEAETAIKWCQLGESRLTKARAQLLQALPDLAAMDKALAVLKFDIATVRLDLENQVRAEKQRRKETMISAAVEKVIRHYHAAGKVYSQPSQLIDRMSAALKGLRSAEKMQNALDRIILAEQSALQQPSPVQPITVNDINTALSPLWIAASDLVLFGLQPIDEEYYNAADFPGLCQQLITHIQTARLPAATTI